MRNQIGIIVNALDAEAEKQATKGGIMGVRLHSMLCAIASRIQKAEADFARLHPSGQHVETRHPAVPTDTHTVILPSGTGQQVQDVIARLMGERDEAVKQQRLAWGRAAENDKAYAIAIAERDEAKKTAHDMLKARKDRIAYLEACGKRQAATITERDKKVAALESEMQDAAGLRAALDAARQKNENQANTLRQIGEILGALQVPLAGYTSTRLIDAAHNAVERAAHADDERAEAVRRYEAAEARADDLQADADAAWNFAGVESDGMPTPEGPGRWGRIEEMTRRHVQAIRQWQARAERAEKALAADTLDIVRTFHGEAAKDGESLARYVASNVETLRAALRSVLLPLTLLTHHRGQFRPEDGLLDRLAKLAKRPQS